MGCSEPTSGPPPFAAAGDAGRILEAIVGSAQLAILAVDLDARIIAWNRGAERLFLHPAHAVLGRPLALIVPPDRAGEPAELMARLRRGEPVEHFRTRRARADGAILEVAMTWSPIRDADGALTGAAILIQDLSEQVRAEADLRRMALGASLPHGEAFFGALVAYLCQVLEVEYAMVLARDPLDATRLVAPAIARDGVSVSPQRLPLAGPLTEVVLSGMAIAAGGDLAARYPGCARHAAEWGIEAYVGVPLRDEAGRTIGALAIAHPAPIQDQAFVHELLEVTARRTEAELQRRLDRSELAESEARYRLLVEMFPDAVVVQEQGVIRFANPSAAAMLLEGPAEDMRGRRFADFVDGGAPDAPGPGPAERLLRGADGQLREVEVTTAAIGFQGRPAELVVMHDVSARREVARMKDEFIAMVSHELRHPINTIVLALDAMAGGTLGEVPPPIARMITIAQDNTDRLARLVADMLELQVLEADRVRIAPRPCDVRKLVQDAVDAVASMARGHHVELDAGPVPEGLGLLADAGRVHQVLVNLLVNAVRHSPSGGRVRLAARREAGEVRLRVEDQGPGVPWELRERIFERFFLGPPAPNAATKGTGLGLAICRLVVQLHGGRIHVEDAAGGGAAFVVALPTEPPQHPSPR